MAIAWLKPKQGMNENDFILLCEGATVHGKENEQKVYFGPKTTLSLGNTLQFLG